MYKSVIGATSSNAPLSDASVYLGVNEKADSDETLISPMSHQWIVNRVSTDITETASQSVSYRYEGLLLHTGGLGSLGFRKLITEDEQSGVITTTEYFQSTDIERAVLNGMPLTTEQTLNGERLSYAQNTLKVRKDSQGGGFGYVAVSLEKQYRLSSAMVSSLQATTTVTQQYDGFGNLLSNQVDTQDGSIAKTVKTENEYSDRRYGRLSRTEVNRTRTNRQPRRRVSEFAYQSNGLISSTVVAPQNPDYRLETRYSYDRFGQKTEITQSGVAHPGEGKQTRRTRINYTSDGRLISSKENALGEITTFSYNGSAAASAYGPVYQITQRSPNGLENIRWFDGFGRQIQQQTPDGVITEVKRSLCYRCEENSWQEIETSQTGAPASKTYLDRWGREVMAMTERFDGSWVKQRKTYDSQGRPAFVYEPGNSRATKYSYDVLGRPISILAPNDAETNITYYSDYTRTTNELSQSSWEYINGFGETTKTQDDRRGKVFFTYDASGNLIQSSVTPGSGSSPPRRLPPGFDDNILHSSAAATIDGTVVEYDDWGYKVSMTDPVKGHWRYRYNAFGELVEQTSAHDETQTWRFDALGRTVEMRQPRAGVTCYSYGRSANQNSIGRLVKLRHFENDSESCASKQQAQYQKSLSYDAAGRLKTLQTMIDGQRYAESYTYDAQGRLSTTKYPNAGTQTVTVKTHYNAQGYAYELERVETGVILKTITDANARGQATRILYAGGQKSVRTYNAMGWMTYTNATSSNGALNAVRVDHDELGNVTSRLSYFGRLNGHSSEVSEQYEYDSLNRLTRSEGQLVDGSFSTQFNSEQHYDGYGNITYRSGNGQYIYSDDNARRLVRIEPKTIEVMPLPTPKPPGGGYPCCFELSSGGFVENEINPGIELDFSYDESGNVLSDGERQFTYNGDDKLTRVRKGSNTSTLRYVGETLYYQRDELRESGRSVTYVHHRVGGFERKQRSGGAGALTEYRYTIGDDLVIVERSDNTSDTYVLFKDHIGSVFTMLSTDGTVVSQQVFTAFGKKRTLYSQSLLSSDAILAPTDQGFTGHRQMDAFGIVHMKGRIYDPTIGRFLQADPHIQSPLNSQSHNRYSYVLNNPMSYTDPSGYFFKSLFKGIKKYWRTIAAIAVTYFTAGAASGWAASWGCRV